jgi:hypothetical protein
MRIETKSALLERYFYLSFSLLIALITGPFIVISLITAAYLNSVTDPVSYTILGICSLFFLFISYRMFRSIYFIIFENYKIQIDENSKIIKILSPVNEIIKLVDVKSFHYINNTYVFRFNNTLIINNTLTIKRNTDFEMAVKRLTSLDCTLTTKTKTI